MRVQRLGGGLGRRRLVEGARHRLPAAAQHEAQAQALGLVEHHGRGVVGHAGVAVVLVVGHGRAAGQQQFHQPDARGDAHRVLAAEEAAVGHRHRRQPGREREADAGRDALQQALEQVVVGVDPAGVDDAAAGVDDPLAGLRVEMADGLDHAGASPDVVAELRVAAHGPSGLTGQQVGGVLDEQGGSHWDISHGTFRCRASRPAPSARARPCPRTAPRRAPRSAAGPRTCAGC